MRFGPHVLGSAAGLVDAASVNPAGSCRNAFAGNRRQDDASDVLLASRAGIDCRAQRPWLVLLQFGLTQAIPVALRSVWGPLDSLVAHCPDASIRQQMVSRETPEHLRASHSAGLLAGNRSAAHRSLLNARTDLRSPHHLPWASATALRTLPSEQANVLRLAGPEISWDTSLGQRAYWQRLAIKPFAPFASRRWCGGSNPTSVPVIRR